MRGSYRFLGLWFFAASISLRATCAIAGDPFSWAIFERAKPAADREASVECVAKQIDWLEHYIDEYGTVVPKQPDIWGQARLTRYRQEFEREMAGDAGGFAETLQGAIRRADESYLGMAFAIGAATGNGVAVPSTDTIAEAAAPSADDAAGVARTAPQTDFAKRGGYKSPQLSLEPSLYVEQKARYLNHLQQLRRINEGDDTADSPGYSLNLIRIPVSVMPGKKTDHGFGAEITVTATPQLTEALLPSTFRNLVINDVVDQLALPIMQIIYEHRQDAEFWGELKEAFEVSRQIDAIVDLAANQPTQAQQCYEALAAEKGRLLKNIAKCCGKCASKKDNGIADWHSNAMNAQKYLFRTETLRKALVFRSPTLPLNLPVSTLAQRRSRMPIPPSQLRDLAGDDLSLWAPLLLAVHDATHGLMDQQKMISLGDVEAYLRAELDATYDFLALPENTHLWNNCQLDLVKHIRNRLGGVDQLKPTDRCECMELTEDEGAIGVDRCTFVRAVNATSMRGPQPVDIQYTPAPALAWAIVVEAALLNQRLIEDMRRVSIEKGCACLALDPENAWPPFYLPWPHRPEQGPPSEVQRQAAALFNEYVRCRWPVIVFALDPATDDQNIADMYSARREMKIAIAAAVSTGKVSPAAALNFVRRLEVDIETIAVNRTGVGFVHGNDTFGWRFFPRLQTPPNKGNLHAFWQTWMGGPTSNQMLRERQLEPGIRECVAIVVMPSFVPQLIVETRANWFALTNPSHKEMALHDSMKISREFQSVRCTTTQICQSCAYRPGDVERMIRAVDQIEKRLPLQTMRISVPYENTLGGFGLFSSGITDLGPELRGWYGEPGIRVAAYQGAPTPGEYAAYSSLDIKNGSPGTTLFLVGRHFSVHDTQVVVGGRLVPCDLLSREVARVVVPYDVNWSLNAQNERVVDIHLATAYGISQHLFVPVATQEMPEKAPAKSGFAWVKQEPISASLGLLPQPSGCLINTLCANEWSRLGNNDLLIRPKAGLDWQSAQQANVKAALQIAATLTDDSSVEFEADDVPVEYVGMIDGLNWPFLPAGKFTEAVNKAVGENTNLCNRPKQLQISATLVQGSRKIALNEPLTVQICVPPAAQPCPCPLQTAPAQAAVQPCPPVEQAPVRIPTPAPERGQPEVVPSAPLPAERPSDGLRVVPPRPMPPQGASAWPAAQRIDYTSWQTPAERGYAPR